MKTGKSIRELVLERGLHRRGAPRRDPVGGVDDAGRSRRRDGAGQVGRADGQEGGTGRYRLDGRQERNEARASHSSARRASFAFLPFLPFLPYLPDPPCPTCPPARPPVRPAAEAQTRLFGRRISGCSKRPIAISGRSPIRSWTRSASPKGRWSPSSAPPAAGSRCSSPARRAERPRLRRRHPARDARGDQPPHAEREPHERDDRCSARRAIRGCRRGSTPR